MISRRSVVVVVLASAACYDSTPPEKAAPDVDTVAIQIRDLEDRSSRMRPEVAWQLGRSKDARAVPALIAVLNEEDLVLSWKAAQALGEIGDSRAVDALASLLTPNAQANSSYDVRREAALALGKIGDRRAVPSLTATLTTDSDGNVRRAAAVALGQLRDSRAVPALLTALGDVHGSRVEAWQALLNIERDGVVPLLIRSLTDKDPQTRSSAVFALGEVDQPDVVEPLLGALESRDSNVRKQAINALRKTSTANVSAGLDRLDSAKRSRAATLLRQNNLLLSAQTATALLSAPRDGMAHVWGTLIYQGRAPQAVPIYLHRIKPDELSFEPQTWTDESGRWAVLNVRPGNYILKTGSPAGGARFPGVTTIGMSLYEDSEVRAVKANAVVNFGTQTIHGAEGFR